LPICAYLPVVFIFLCALVCVSLFFCPFVPE
jgi:hypothetical protein